MAQKKQKKRPAQSSATCKAALTALQTLVCGSPKRKEKISSSSAAARGKRGESGNESERKHHQRHTRLWPTGFGKREK
jgi:hypothetical protein